MDAWSGVCPACFSVGQLRPAVVRPRAEIDRQLARSDARALAKMRWARVSTTAYPQLVMGNGALVLVAGAPGAGKSTWACRAANGLRGPALLVSAEEALAPSLAARLHRAGVVREDFKVIANASVDDVVNEARTLGAVVLVVDSVSVASWSPRDLRHAIELLPSLAALLATVHQTKSGIPAGSHQLLHEADVVVAVAAMRWRVVKSRYAPLDQSDHPVLPEPPQESVHA